MKDLSLEDFRKLSSDKRATELFKLLMENNRLLRESPSESNSNASAQSHVKKIHNGYSPKVSRRVASILKKMSSSHDHNKNTLGNNVWKNALNLNSDLHDPWINLFKSLYGDDYFDRIRSLAKSKSETAIINVGGERHEVTFQTLAKLPQTRLAKLRGAKTQAELNMLCDRYDGSNEYFFDRNPRSMAAIINFYRIGKLHVELFVEPCCQEIYYGRKDQMKKASQREEDDMYVFPNTCLGRTKQWWWYLFEYPSLSLRSRIVAVISFFFVLLSTVVLVVSTLLEDSHRNDPNYSNPFIDILEAIYMTWFTVEFLVRFLSCPDHCKFIKSFMNIIDLLAILPYYLAPLMNQLQSVKQVGQVLRILRIMRVFKMARHSRGLQGLGYTMKASYKELILILMFVGIGILIFSSLTYMSESDQSSTSFTSVIDAFWWAAITMTTVGYGDVTPKTVVGRIVGSICAITGTLVIALPVPIVSENFSLFYKQERRRRMVQERRAALEKAHMEGRVMDYGAVREDKAAQIIQERFRGRVSVRKSITSLRVQNEYEENYRRGSRHRKSRVSSEDRSIQEDQPPYFKRKVKIDEEGGNLNGGFTRSGSISIDDSLSPNFGRRHHHHHHHQHR